MKSYWNTALCLALFVGLMVFWFSPLGRSLIGWIETAFYWGKVALAVGTGVIGILLGIVMMLRDTKKHRAADAAEKPEAESR